MKDSHERGMVRGVSKGFEWKVRCEFEHRKDMASDSSIARGKYADSAKGLVSESLKTV